MLAKRFSIFPFILWILKNSSSDPFQVVDHGPCTTGGDYYCQQRVKNSYCSQATNKCFCQSNFVAIRERESITCKSLLTDLKCGMDQDCTDVYNSICHPGASECTCPAQTFYVPGTHSCESESLSSSFMCNQCKNSGGQCYSRSTNVTTNEHSSKKQNLCSCPGITIFNDNLGENEENAFQCNKIWVDIGDICDNVTRLCRSHKSLCMVNEIAGYGICQCRRYHLPVYQKNLNFHECYIEQQDNNHRNCRQCKQIEGACINMNEESSTDACICPLSRKAIFYDNIIRKPSEIIASLKCVTTNEMVDVKCDMKRFSVCIHINEIEFPNFAENIRKNLSKIFFSDRIIPNKQFSVNGIQRDTDPLCYLAPTANVFNSNLQLCRSLIYDEKNGKFPCGINTVQYMNGYFYSGYIELWGNVHIPNLLVDKLFDVSCKSSNIRTVDTVGQAIDRSWPATSYQIVSREFQTDPDFLSFSAVDINNRMSDFFIKFSPIRLQAKVNPNTSLVSDLVYKFSCIWCNATYIGETSRHLHRRVQEHSQLRGVSNIIEHRKMWKASYKHISADLCWAQNTSHLIPHQTERWNIIHRGCAFKDSGFTSNFLQVYDSTTITSALFPLFQISNSENIFFKCIFRLCTTETWCKTDYDCSTNLDRSYSSDPPPQNMYDIKYISKSLVLTIGLQKQFQSDSRIKNGLSECHYFWCVTKLKLAIISMIIGGIVLLATAIFLLLCYRQKIIRDINRCQRLSSRTVNVNTTSRQQQLNLLTSSNCNPVDCSSYMLVPVAHRSHHCQPVSFSYDRTDLYEAPLFINSSVCTVNRDSDLNNDRNPIFTSNHHNEIITINNSGDDL